MFTLQKNSSISALPDSAESVTADQKYQSFPQSKKLPALIVYQRPSSLTDADRARIDRDREAVERKITEGAEVHEARFARDGRTAVVEVDLPVPGTELSFEETADVGDSVRAIQRLVGRGDGGLDVAVTGQAGYTTANADIMRDVNMALFLGTLLVLLVVLVVAHRSPLLWAVTLAVAAFALAVAEGMVYLLGKATGLTYTTLSQGLLTVLALCGSTLYGLLLIARYREELRTHADRHEAMRAALPRAGGAVVTSAVAVVVGLLSLAAADLETTRGLGPVSAVAVVCALAVSMTLLPAALLVFGRWIFWPRIPRHGTTVEPESGFWGRLSERVGRRPRLVWAATTAVLGALSLGLLGSHTGLSTNDSFAHEPQAVAGQRMLAKGFPAGTTCPVIVIARSDAAERTLAAVRGIEGLAQPRRVAQAGELTLITATPTSAPAGRAALETVRHLRETLRDVPGADAVVGGQDAIALDRQDAESRDRMVVIPLLLLVLALALGLLLRSVVAPLVLVASVVLAYAAALGLSVAAHRPVFGFAGQDGTLALHSLAYLMTFGVGHGVFLLRRVQEERARLGTEAGVHRAVAVTAPALTGAALVVAATFSALALVPLVGVVEVAVVVALGVLLDAFVVRPVLLPALLLDLGDRMGWPRALPAGLSPGTASESAEPAPSRTGAVAGGRDV
ncbi:MMPL family transporter [Streptomyces sp. NBC_00557]|uniref:MMPL family transporter n=1 Tax=Streptomyces sp. NBC_00557 TaxID=2975776 RepID=UPI002E804876|nr:MMPL family transporter [Streptomyces sp. NBC_00557]WUC40335.1 MMPL family transporter [Streptomyces sp. NBC_00557]